MHKYRMYVNYATPNTKYIFQYILIKCNETKFLKNLTYCVATFQLGIQHVHKALLVLEVGSFLTKTQQVL
jgi:hypothetical protein